jgi:hypothetical protein
MVSVYMQVNGETSKHFLGGAVFSLSNTYNDVCGASDTTNNGSGIDY